MLHFWVARPLLATVKVTAVVSAIGAPDGALAYPCVNR